MEKKLPLGTPPIISYLFHMYPLSILAQDDAFLPWFYSTHIQLFNFPGEELKFYTHPFCTRHEIRHLYYQACPFLDVQTIDRNLLSLAPTDLVPQLIGFVDRGYYVQIDVDFFYLPDRLHYRRSHFIHDLLVSGYDTQTQTLEISGFDAEGRYAVSTLPFAAMIQALSFTRAGHIEQTRQSEPSLPSWFIASMTDRPRLFLYKHLLGQRFTFDPISVTEQLEDYLAARDTSRRFRLLAVPREGGVWGTDVYAFLKENTTALSVYPAAYRDIPLRLFWEHKKCMQARLCHMEEAGYLDPEDRLSIRFDAIAKKASSLRLVMLRWKTHHRSETLERACDMLDLIATEERPLLEEALERLHAQSAPNTKSRQTYVR